MFRKQTRKKIALIILLTCSVVFFCASTGQAMTSCDNEINIMSSGVKFEPSHLSREESKWFHRFMEGGLLVDGWKDITKKVLANTPEEQRQQQRQRLELLGIKIGTEWSKDNAIRKVDTNQLMIWGEKLKQAVKKQPEQLAYVIALIDREVDSLLN